MAPHESTLKDILSQLSDDDTAFIVHDLDVVGDHVSALEVAFPRSVRHAAAIKTMPHRRVLEYLASRGLALEAASFEEVQMAAAAGVGSDMIVFDSPVKTQREIDLCMECHPGMLMNANSLSELARYGRGPNAKVGLRVNPLLVTGASSPFDVSTANSKFGVPADRIEEILAARRRHDFTGLHMHIGSGLTGVESHVAAAKVLLGLARRIDDDKLPDQRGITVIDIGGGLAAEPLDGDSRMSRLGKRLLEECPDLFDYEVWTEFGQWLHADAGWAASRVEYVEERDVPIAYLHLGADYFLRRVHGYETDYSYSVHSPDGTPRDAPLRAYDLVGPLCHAGDVLERNILLPAMAPGDWLVIGSTGANTYGLWSRHCSRALPRVLGVQGGRVSTWDERRPVHS